MVYLSAFHCTSTPSGNQIPLDENEKDQHRYGDQHSSGHDHSPIDHRCVIEICDANRKGLQFIRCDQNSHENIVIPCQNEGEDCRGNDPWQGEREDDMNDSPETGRTIHQGCLLQNEGDALEEGPQEPQAEGETKGGVGHDEGKMGIGNAYLFNQHIKGNYDHNGSEHVGEENEASNLLPTIESESGQAVSPGCCNCHGEDDGQR